MFFNFLFQSASIILPLEDYNMRASSGRANARRFSAWPASAGKPRGNKSAVNMTAYKFFHHKTSMVLIWLTRIRHCGGEFAVTRGFTKLTERLCGSVPMLGH